MMQFLADNIVLLGIIFLCIVMLFFPNVGRKNNGSIISNDEAIEFINKKNAILIDVRPEGEFAKGSIAQAKNIPFTKFPESIPSIPQGKPIILVDTLTANSSRAARLLAKAKYKDVYVLDKGIRGWKEARLPFKR